MALIDPAPFFLSLLKNRLYAFCKETDIRQALKKKKKKILHQNKLKFYFFISRLSSSN